MSSPDEQTLALNFAVGRSIYNNVARLASETLFYGFFIAMFTYAIGLFVKRRSKIMVAIACFAFLMATLHWTSTLSFDLTQISALLKSDLELDVAGRIAILPPKVFVQDVISQWTGTLTPILSDATLIWRCLAIYPETKFLLILPFTTLFATTGLTLFFLISLSDITTWTSWANGYDEPVLSNVQLSMFILSFCTNFLTTLVMAYKLWMHRRFIQALVGKRGIHRSAQHVVALLLETGLAYSAFQLGLIGLAAVPNDTDSTTQTAGMAYLAIYCQLSAMYPIAVIIIVQLNLSMMVNTTALAAGTETSATVEFTDMATTASTGQAIHAGLPKYSSKGETSSGNDSQIHDKSEGV